MTSKIESLANPLKNIILSFAPEQQGATARLCKAFNASVTPVMVKEWGKAEGEKLLARQREISLSPPTLATVSSCFEKLKSKQNELVGQAKDIGCSSAGEREAAIKQKYGTAFPMTRFMEVEKLLEDSEHEVAENYEALWFGRPTPGAAPLPNTGIFAALTALNIAPPLLQDANEIRAWLNNDANRGTLEQITSLYVHSLNMTKLPKEIAKLTNLTILFVSNNNLKDLPTEITQLRSLIYLDLMNNRFTKIPEMPKPATIVNIALNPIKKISEADYKRWNSVLNTVLPFDILYANFELEEFPLAILVREICKLPAYIYGALLLVTSMLVHSFLIDLLLAPILPDFLVETLTGLLFLATLILSMPIVAWGILSAYLFTPILLPIIQLFGYKPMVQVNLGELV